jgi:hypothetical protein
VRKALLCPSDDLAIQNRWSGPQFGFNGFVQNSEKFELVLVAGNQLADTVLDPDE